MATARKAAEKPVDTPNEDLSDLLERLGGDAKYIRLYRIVNGKQLYLKRLGPHVELEDVQEGWGGGEFLVQVCGDRGRFLGERRFEIAGRPRDPDEAPEERLVGYSATPANAHRPPKTLAESIAQLQEVIEGARNPPPVAQQGNPLDMATALIAAGATALGPILEFMKDRPRGGGSGDALELALKIHEAHRDGLKTGMMLARKNGGGEVGSQDILGRMLDTIGGLARGGAPAHQEDPLALGAGGAPPVAGHQNLGQTWTKVVAPHMPRLIKLAREGKDPHLYADLLLSDAPDELLELIVVQLQRGEEFWTEFSSAFPGADRAWFTKLLSRVWEGVQPEDSGNAENAPGDVPPGNDPT